MAYDDNDQRVRRNPLAGYMNGAINGVSDTSQPGRNIPASNYGAINGVNDPTQSAYRAPRAQPINPAVTSTFSPAPTGTADNLPLATRLGQGARTLANNAIANTRQMGVGYDVASDRLGALGAGIEDAMRAPFVSAANMGQEFREGFTGQAQPRFNPNASADAYSANSYGPPKPANNIQPRLAGPVSNAVGANPDAAAEAELSRTMSDLNNPSNPQSPLANRFSNVTAGSRTFNNGTSPIGTQTPTRGDLVQRGQGNLNATEFAQNAQARGGVKRADGSYEFSNIPGQSGYSSRLNDLGNNINVASGTNMANPGLGTTGGYVPTTDESSGIRFGNPNDVGFDNSPGALAQRQSRSDLLSVLNEDPRSAMGIAARNARMNLADIRISRGRYGGQSSPYEQVLGALENSAASPLNQYQHDSANAARLDEVRLHNQGSLADTNLRGQYGLAETNAKVNADLNKPQYETDANGNLVRVQGTNAQGVTQSGNPLAVRGKIDAPEEKAYQQMFNDVYKAQKGNGVSDDDAYAAASAAANKHVTDMRNRGKTDTGKKVTRTGTIDGKKVVQYNDGTIEYAS